MKSSQRAPDSEAHGLDPQGLDCQAQTHQPRRQTIPRARPLTRTLPARLFPPSRAVLRRCMLALQSDAASVKESWKPPCAWSARSSLVTARWASSPTNSAFISPACPGRPSCWRARQTCSTGRRFKPTRWIAARSTSASRGRCRIPTDSTVWRRPNNGGQSGRVGKPGAVRVPASGVAPPARFFSPGGTVLTNMLVFDGDVKLRQA